jgi:hypothetical protein
MINEPLRWRKSSFSGSGDAGNGACVELALLATGRLAIRDSKNPCGGTILTTRATLEMIKQRGLPG